MEAFKSKIKKRILIFSCLAVLASAVGIYDAFFVSNAEGSTFSSGTVMGFCMGMIIGLGFIAIAQVVRFGKALQDEKQLKLLYNKEHDERLQAIRSKAGMPMIMIMSVLMIAAAIVGSFFNETVFYTLLAAGIVQLLIGSVVKIYCLKKM